MNKPPIKRSIDPIEFVIKAIGGKTPSLRTMLEELVLAFDAAGCVLWECGRHESRSETQYRDNLEDDHLFVLAAYFRDDQIFALHDLPVALSLTGQALLKNETLSTSDIQAYNKFQNGASVFQRLRLGPMVSAPMTFIDGFRGAANLYREREAKPFGKHDEDLLANLARAIPSLYQAIRDKVSLDLVSDVNDLLTTRTDGPIRFSAGAADMYLPLKQAVLRIAKTFHSLEVSVFLENPLEAPGRYQCVATTWPESLPQDSYGKNPKDGMTGWVLHHGKPTIIFDWETYRKHRQFYEQQNPGHIWKDPLRIIEKARQLLELTPSDTLPPLSYMAAPIFLGDQAAGIIRCTAGQLGEPYYYNKRDLDLLQLVAAQISRYWGAWLSNRQIVAEKETWEAHTFEDLEHQVRGPLNQVRRRVEWLMDEYGRDNRKLAAVRGLCRKAVRATRSIGLLARLADEKALSLSLVPLNYDSLIKLLIELAEDNQAMVDPGRDVRFEVNRPSFSHSFLSRISVDEGLFEQVLNNVLDNAGKYSYPGSTVRVFGGATNKGNFHFTVANTGIRIRSDEVTKCLERGWRSESAKNVSDEGSGIGLWMADRIMKAHGGYLEIVPTGKEGETQVKLIFPTTYTRG